MSEGACQHFEEYYKEYGLDSFNVVHAYFSASVTKEARRQKVNEIIWFAVKYSFYFIQLELGIIMLVLYLR